MKIGKGLITAVFIVLIAVFAIFPAQSEAASYGLVQVYDGDTVLVNGTPYSYAYFESTVNQPGNTIGTLSFYNTVHYSFTAEASITSLTVEALADVSLYSLVGTNVTVNSGGTVQNNISTTGSVTVNGGTLEEGVVNSSLVNATMGAAIN